MPLKDKEKDKSMKKNDGSASLAADGSASVAPVKKPAKEVVYNETHQLEGNDSAAVYEAATRAEKAVSDAVRGVAQVIESMKSSRNEQQK